MRLRTLALVLLAALGLVAASASAGALELITPDTTADDIPSVGLSTAAPQWASVNDATIRPGSQTSSDSGGCTANFVFYDATDVYLGSAAHCTIAPGHSDPNGCVSRSRPEGTKVTVQGATRPATLVYNSWRTMERVGERDLNTCEYNDFALLRLDPADHHRVNPTLPHWNGPEGISNTTRAGEEIYANGNSRLRLGLEALQPKVGVALGEHHGGWAHRVYLAAPGIPGDSGGAVLDHNGQAVGVFHTIVVAPYTGANEASDLNKSLGYMRTHTDAFDGVVMAVGSRPFSRIPV